MSHTQPDPRSVVRIGIALTALKHRARDQSIASYLLDLQSCFPVTTNLDETRNWRTYALELEKQVTALKAQCDADQELLSKLPANASQTTQTSDAPPPRKKSKKNPTKDLHDRHPEWNWDQSRAEWSRFLSQYPSSPSLVAAYTSLKGALVTPNADPLLYASRLTDAILRTLDITYRFLFSQNSSLGVHAPHVPLQLQLEHIDSTRIALASPLIMYVLRTALHALVRTIQDSTKSKRPRPRPHAALDAQAHLDKVLDCLLECLLLPLLRVIVPLCSSHLAPLVSTPFKKDKDKADRTVGESKDKDKGAGTVCINPPRKIDARTDVFALIGTSLEALDSLPPLITTPGSVATRGGENTSIATGIRDRLGLETIRELEALYSVPPSSHIPLVATSSQPTPTLTPTSPSAPTPSQAQSQSQPQFRVGVHTQPPGRVPVSRTKHLERCVGTREERVRALVTRDAGWFLARTLHLCLTPSWPMHGQRQDGGTEPSGDLLRGALLDRVGKLVRSVNLFDLGGVLSDSTHTGHRPGDPDVTSDDPVNLAHSRFAIDPVCQNMLLAICERALGHLVSS